MHVIEKLIVDLDSCRRVVRALKQINPDIRFVFVESSVWDRIYIENKNNNVVDGVTILWDKHHYKYPELFPSDVMKRNNNPKTRTRLYKNGRENMANGK